MSKIEKTTIAVISAVLITSFSIYGVWEDKMTFLAPLMVLIYTAFAVWVASGGWRDPTSHSLHSTTHKSISVPPGGGILLLFWLYSAVMIPFSAVPYEAKISVLRFGCYVGTYWVCANILSRFSRRRMVWGVLLVALLAVALYSLVQHQMAPNLIFGVERYYSGYWDNGRLGGTFLCPNHIAHLFQMWIPFCLVFLFIPQFGWFWRICFGYALPVFVFLIYRTQSRAGLLGTVAAAGTLILLLMLRKSRRAFLISLVVVPVLAASAVGGLWGASSMFRERMQPVVKVVTAAFAGEWEQAVSIDFRPQTWADSILMIKDHPLVGVGPGNYGQTFYKYRQRVFANRLDIDHPHSEPIEFLVEYGLIGAVLLGWALICVILALLRIIKTSDHRTHVLPAAAFLSVLAGTAVHGLFDFELRIFPNALMLFVLAGCAVAPLLAQQKSVVRSQKSVPFLTSAFRSLIFVTLLLAAVWAVQVMSSAALRVFGDRSVASGDRARAEKLYKAAVAIDPQNWRANLGLGQIYSYTRYQELNPVLKKEKARLERDTFAKAFRCNDKKEEVVYGLGRAELMAGHRAAGLEYLRRAAKRKRFNDFYWRKLGIELRKAGLYDEALKTFEYAQKLDRSNKTVRRNIQWLNSRMGVTK